MDWETDMTIIYVMHLYRVYTKLSTNSVHIFLKLLFLVCFFFFCITKYAQYLNYCPQTIFGELQKQLQELCISFITIIHVSACILIHISFLQKK